MGRVMPSATNAVLALAAELREAGRDIVSLGAGEPDFDTPDHIKEAGIEAIRAGMTKYTAIDGTSQLKAAIQRKFVRDNDLAGRRGNYSGTRLGFLSRHGAYCRWRTCRHLYGS